jgi:DNA mismatch endonuclease, patch repair protein
MQAQRRAGTRPELAVRRAAHRLGLRYFVGRRPLASLRRTADLVFPRRKLAVFVDGCFWHGCPEHARGGIGHNRWYWPEKIASNQRRDLDTDERLAEEGWMTVRIWEHEDPDEAAQRIMDALQSRL